MMQGGRSFTKIVQLAVKKEKFTISLVRLNENNFLSTLHTNSPGAWIKEIKAEFG
jgi:hypothetical protein